MTKVEWGPCCFCELDVQPSDIDPCRVQVSTTSAKWQTWFCHAACFKQRIVNPPDAPGLLDPAHFQALGLSKGIIPQKFVALRRKLVYKTQFNRQCR